MLICYYVIILLYCDIILSYYFIVSLHYWILKVLKVFSIIGLCVVDDWLTVCPCLVDLFVGLEGLHGSFWAISDIILYYLKLFWTTVRWQAMASMQCKGMLQPTMLSMPWGQTDHWVGEC